MLGRDHALSGALAFAALAPTLHVVGADLVTGIALSTGAGLLPDIDHPDSSVALSYGFMTNSFSWLVEKISGGHRHGTHAIIGVAIFTVGAYFAGKYQFSGPHPPYASPGTPAWHPAQFWHLVPAGLFIALLYSAALRALKIGGHHGDLIALAGAGATLYYGTDLITVTPWHVPLFAFTIALGCAAHIVGDELTHSGCPLLYPVSQHEFHVLPRPIEITTGKIAETYVVFPFLAIGLAAAIWHATGHKL